MSDDRPESAPASDPSPETATPSAPAAASQAVPGQALMVTLVAIATVLMVVSVVMIFQGRQWDEARRVLQACHAELTRLIQKDLDDYESNHRTRLEQAEAEIRRLRDTGATADRIEAAESRRASLAEQEYEAPPMNQLVSGLVDGAVVPILLEGATRDFELGDLKWFTRGDFTWHSYTPADGMPDPRTDANGRHWYIEVRIPARDDEDSDGESASPVAGRRPPEGWGRIYADGSMLGPLAPDEDVPEGHPARQSESDDGADGMRPFPGRAPGGS